MFDQQHFGQGAQTLVLFTVSRSAMAVKRPVLFWKLARIDIFTIGGFFSAPVVVTLEGLHAR